MGRPPVGLVFRHRRCSSSCSRAWPLDVAYNRRSFSGFFVVDNLPWGRVTSTAYTVTAPLHPDLPDGGGYSFTALNIKPNKFAQFQNFYTFSSNYGDEIRNTGTVSTSPSTRGRAMGWCCPVGTSTGRGVRDNCDIVTALPETLASTGPESTAAT